MAQVAALILPCAALTGAEKTEKIPWTWSDEIIPDLGFDLDAARVIKVTSLEGTGDGSLRDALWKDGPRIIVFEVGGVIDLGKKDLTIKNPQVIVAGQTAPAPGITLIRGGISVSASQVLLQHLAIRPGDAGEKKGSGYTPDGISTSRAVHDVWVDHCSLTWAVDENLSASGYGAPEGEFTRRVYFRDCLVAEGLNDSSHEKGPHSKGTLILDGTREVAIVRCLYAANVERNPLFKPETSGVVVNCLMSSVGQRSLHAGGIPADDSKVSLAKVAAVGNVVLFAPHTKESGAVAEGPAEWFMEDNFGKNAVGEAIPQIRNGEALLDQAPVWPIGLKAIPSAEVIDFLSRNVGARPGQRDPIDHRIVTSAVEQSGKIIDSQEDVGGYPAYDPTTHPLEVPETGRREWLARMAQALTP